MKKVLIIEDEQLSANRLKRMILDIDPTIKVCGPITSIQEVVNTLKQENDYNLIFSDIRLGANLVFEAFNEIMPNSMVVFTTAYDEYALEAIRHHGVDYLLKPIDAQDLVAVMDKVSRWVGDIYEHKESLSQVAQTFNCYRERLLVIKGDELISLRVSDISYIYKEEDKVMVYTIMGNEYRLSLTMGDLENQLSPKMFFRLNRQYISHIDSIKKISFYFGGKLKVKLSGCCDDHIFVSRERVPMFKQWLDK